eukprot:NODE_8238_length_366_cov_71.668770_g6499_i0.p2 GENE.NODE_8238_length_366_cov_71.668770_g6499_i0~~NODE_8238_length_366_cov_71.668770_g6499_i0.p2  ORF type:complete len:67 (-),score=11.55 NODE_8238_length_366_cov_71.668770_g6499_i0:66-266(-)
MVAGNRVLLKEGGPQPTQEQEHGFFSMQPQKNFFFVNFPKFGGFGLPTPTLPGGPAHPKENLVGKT